MRRFFVLLPILAAGCAVESAPIADPEPVTEKTPTPSAPAPGEAPPTGTATSEARVLDVTSDGVAIFVRGESLVASDLTDGTETVLADRFGASGRALVDGRAVAFWTDVEGGIGTLGTFTKAHGRGAAVSGSLAGVFAASADGSRTAFVAHATNGASGVHGDVLIGDGTAVPNVAVGAAECAPMLAWANDSLLASTCAPGEAAPAIRAVKGATVTTLLANAKRGWALDDAKARAFVIDRNGKASVRTLGASGGTTIDRNVVWGRFAPDGGHVLYRTTANDLRRAVVSGPATPPSTLIEGVRAVDAISRSGDWMLASEAPPDASNDACTRSDVHLTPVPPGMPFIPTPTVPVDLVTTSTGQALGFTSDDRFAVYIADLPAKGAALGTLRVREAKDVGVGADTELAKGVLGARILDGTTTIVFARARGETFDLVSADAATGASTVLVEDASPAFATTADRLVYAKRGSSSVAATGIPTR